MTKYNYTKEDLVMNGITVDVIEFAPNCYDYTIRQNGRVIKPYLYYYTDTKPAIKALVKIWGKTVELSYAKLVQCMTNQNFR